MTDNNALDMMQIASVKADNELLLAKIADAKAQLEVDVEQANVELEKKRQAILKEMAEQRAADLATVQANVDAHIETCAKAQLQVEEARSILANDVKALKAESLGKHAALKKELEASAKAIVKGAGADKKWAVDIINESSATILSRLDDLMDDHDALIGWVEPKPVDPDEIAKVIARDLKTLRDEKG